MQSRYFLHCLAILLVACTGMVSCTFAITLELSRPPASSDAFFFQANHWSPLFTDLPELQLTGTVEDERLSFLLMTLNDQHYGLRPEGGRFAAMISLNPGPNEIRIESNLRSIEAAEKTVYRVESARLVNLQEQILDTANSVRGGEIHELGNEESQTLELRSPMIQVNGLHGTDPVVELRVKDAYNNTLPFKKVRDQGFTVTYTARERHSYLDFISTLNNRELRRQRLNLVLTNLIELDPDVPENPEGWFTWQSADRMARVQLDTFTLAGSLPAVKEGSVEIIMGTDVRQIPVVNHHFAAELPLRLNQINRGRVRVTLNHQPFFESFQIEQREPTIRVEGLQRYQVDGSLLVPDTAMEVESGTTLRLAQGLLRLFGNAQFEEGLNLVLKRSPDGEVTVLSTTSGPFDVQLALEPGNTGYHLLLEGGGFSRPYYAFDTDVQTAIKIDAVNSLPYRSGPLRLNKAELLLRGRVLGVERGLMNLTLGEEVHAIPVLQQRFEMGQAIPVPEGWETMSLRLQAGELTLEQNFTLEVQAEPTETGAPITPDPPSDEPDSDASRETEAPSSEPET